MRSRLSAAWTVGLCLYAACLALRPLEEADTFFHLSLGRAVLQYGARTVPEPTAFRDFSEPAVASEWLWSAFSYAAYRLGGFGLLSWLAALLAAAAAYVSLRLIRSYWRPEVAIVWREFCCVLVLCTIQCRVVMRPQLLLLLVLPAYILATRAYAQSELPARLRVGALLIVGVILWAQFHGSFVLAPLIFAIQVAPPPAAISRERLRLDAGVLALLLAAMLSSAYGINVAGFITSHAAGDAPRFIAEMARPSWASLQPSAAPSTAAFWLLIGVAVTGMIVARRWFVRELALLALGVALLSTANRFLAEAALLAAPLVAQSGNALALHLEQDSAPRWRNVWHASLITGCALLLAWTAQFTAQQRGPLLRAGLLSAAAPVYATRALATLPDDSAVFTDYTSSAALGFFSAGRLRSFVDGRTPLYFSDRDFGVQRDMLRDGAALRRGLTRYHARAAVVRRDSEACAQLAQFMSVAMVEPLFTTFVASPNPTGPRVLRACGVRYFAADGCVDPELATSIAFVRDHGASEFARFLEADRAVRCNGDAKRALLVLAELTATSRPYAQSFGRTQVEALLRTGQLEAAATQMAEVAGGDDPAIVNLLQSPSAGQLSLESVRRILSSYMDKASDEADPAIRSMLADICLRANDLACVRFHALRAAARGKRGQALDWLAEHDPSEGLRRDAQRWRDLLPPTQ